MHALSVGVFAFQFCGYVALSTWVEWRWYHRRRGEERQWKTQSGKMHGTIHRGAAACDGDGRGRRGYAWGLPALDLVRANPSSNGRHPSHARFATCNLVVSSLFAGATCEAYLENCDGKSFGLGSTLVQSSEVAGLAKVLVGTLLAVTWQSVLEYYWHRAMHLPRVYRLLHKFHHHYKSPQPWDDLFIHPAESFGYCLILYSPAFCVPSLPVQAFLLYMTIMGACGVLDHCGVKMRWPFGAYDTQFHDVHHRSFDANFAFPFPTMDRLHGTHRAS